MNLAKEKELYNKVKNNNEDFKEIYEYFKNDVYRFVYSIINHKEDAEDITSQTFIKFYEYFEKYQWQDKSMKYWLFTTSRNLVIDRFKKPYLTFFDEDFMTETPEITFEEKIFKKEEIDLVMQSMAILKPVEREAVTLRLWEELPFAQIAEIQGLKETTAKLRFYRAIDKLRKDIQTRYKLFLSMPLYFTLIRAVGGDAAYAAPAQLTKNFSNIIINKEKTMSKISIDKLCLTSKVWIALVTILLIITAVVFLVLSQGRDEDNDVNDNKKSGNSKLTISPTPGANTAKSTPSVSPTHESNPTSITIIPTISSIPATATPTSIPESNTKELTALIHGPKSVYDGSSESILLYQIKILSSVDLQSKTKTA